MIIKTLDFQQARFALDCMRNGVAYSPDEYSLYRVLSVSEFPCGHGTLQLRFEIELEPIE